MKTLQINRGNLKDLVEVPSSKSYANRALIISSLLKESPLLTNLPMATDVTFLIRALEKIGLKCEYKNNSLKFLNSFPDCEKSQVEEIYVGEGGTTARFLAALCLLGKSSYTFSLGERLSQRPWDDFLILAESMGGKVKWNNGKLVLQGPIKLPTELKVNCDKTTQFATAFKLLTVTEKSNIIPMKMEASQSYWKMTEQLVRDLPGKKQYSIPLDWSSASYPLAFGALNQKIMFPGLREDVFQADSKFFHLLKKFKCINQNDLGLVIRPLENHQSISFDVSDCLDLVPALSFFLSHVNGEHRLLGVENLIHKESNRLEELKKLLKIFNRETMSRGNEFLIKGNPKRELLTPNLQLPNDHRIVMTGALFLLHHSGGRVGPVDSVAKSYPNFFSLF